MLGNVQKVEISSFGAPVLQEDELPLGVILFPSATSITLKGDMSRSLAQTPFNNSNFTRLQHLHLHSLRLRDENYVEEDWEHWHRLGRHGPPDTLHRLLGEIGRQCSNLKSLKIVDIIMSQNRSSGPEGLASRAALYVWLLLGASATIESFSFEVIGRFVPGLRSEP